jgi:ATP-binding cassette subfamily F protein uup
MSLVQLKSAGLHYGPQVLLEGATVILSPGERVCLVGRNGEGKSSLLKLVAGEIQPDRGEISRSAGCRVSVLEQHLPENPDISVYRHVAGGLGQAGEVLADYQEALQQGEDTGILHERMDALDAWPLMTAMEQLMTRLQLRPGDRLSDLSGGWQRRAGLGRALVGEPDLLLLDEPTNHLDIEAVTWLEQFLAGFSGSLLFVTHDRALARRLATVVWDLDTGVLRRFECPYDRYLQEKEKLLQEEARQQALFDKKLAEEENWIRQGIKARRTRNEGRVRALKALRQEKARQRNRQGRAQLQIEAGDRSGKRVAALKGVSFGYEKDSPLVRDLDFTLMRGDKVGLIGPNGVGKSTLIRLLLGDIKPGSGTVEQGTNVQVAYFDQRRDQLDLDKDVVENVGGGRTTVTINGKDKHIMSYLGDFLFRGDRARTPVGSLSGGERNRVLLARLFSQPANLLVLDEPTNDLDVETLELLEDLLVNFPGTILLVSHDRDFLDEVVGSALVFDGRGGIREYVGGYSDCLRQGAFEISVPVSDKTAPVEPAVKKPSTPPKRKLGYREQQALAALPGRIEALEAEMAALQAQISDPGFYEQNTVAVTRVLDHVKAVQDQLDEAYEHWMDLEG